MCTRNAAHRRKSESSAPSPGSKERIEDASEVFFTNAAAIVRNFDYRFLSIILAIILLTAIDPNFDFAIAVRRFYCINDQVQYGVFDLSRVNGNGYWFRRRLEFDIHETVTRSSIG
jgi:hypothetical protein